MITVTSQTSRTRVTSMSKYSGNPRQTSELSDQMPAGLSTAPTSPSRNGTLHEALTPPAVHYPLQTPHDTYASQDTTSAAGPTSPRQPDALSPGTPDPDPDTHSPAHTL